MQGEFALAKTSECKQLLKAGAAEKEFSRLYKQEDVTRQRERYITALEEFERLFGAEREVCFFSAPGRTEIGGNHTDHQRGRTLAASIDLDAVAVASKNDRGVIHIHSEGHDENIVSLSDLDPKPEEENTSTALVRGIASRFQQLGYTIGGFDAYTTSDVLRGSGLSSSAAFEVLVGTMLNHLYNDGTVGAIEIAQIGQYSENRYFGKPCGLLDQMACSFGGLIEIDFADPAVPKVDQLFCDFTEYGYYLCVVNTGGSHADLTGEYAAVPAEMSGVAKALGKEVLREVNEQEFFRCLPQLRSQLGDRAVLRAIHFFDEDQRVPKMANALRDREMNRFFELVKASGASSACRLQNVTPPGSTKEQGLALALALSERLLNGKGACRVHGGGFAGTIQAYLPKEMAEDYCKEMENVFGKDCCHLLKIRPCGGTHVNIR